MQRMFRYQLKVSGSSATLFLRFLFITEVNFSRGYTLFLRIRWVRINANARGVPNSCTRWDTTGAHGLAPILSHKYSLPAKRNFLIFKYRVQTEERIQCPVSHLFHDSRFGFHSPDEIRARPFGFGVLVLFWCWVWVCFVCLVVIFLWCFVLALGSYLHSISI